MNSSGDKLEKVKEANTEDEVSPVTQMNLSSLTWKSVAEKFAATASSSNQNTSGEMDINAIKNGDFSSIEGTWELPGGEGKLMFDKYGLISSDNQSIYLEGASIVNGYLIARIGQPTASATMYFIPAVSRLPDESDKTDRSDSTRDRMVFYQAHTSWGEADRFHYRVK
ncbi:hypothetical protein D8802_02780 [Streptococcus oralis]|uniref:DUF6287 domain-containing protein n=1 Tax=Streptococcus oralis TaxID=1303 RepID=A0A3R9KGH4_STROR|nr:DUF6287 domain-containing protein [Streptococcus oralis]RSJ67924.1 hypothetical protein D8802_02780 [Streptococcus oralis]